jgi:hypothetical protein
MVSASLVHTNGSQRWFQPSMKARMASLRSRTDSKVPRRMACLVMIPKKISTMFSHDPEVGVKCSVEEGGAWLSGTGWQFTGHLRLAGPITLVTAEAV